MDWWLPINRALHRMELAFLPPHCVLCGARGDDGRDLCEGCHGDLPRIGIGCRRCARPLAHPGICGQCQRRPPPYVRTLAPFAYAPPLDYLVQRLKFHGHLHLARLLGELLAQYLAEHVEAPPDLIIPIPLHRSRLRERGFNQAVELARPVARRLQVPLDWRRCRRRLPTVSQSSLSGDERRRNLRGAFAAHHALAGKRVAIVDDVVTTGTTVGEFAATLRRVGVTEVEVWALARA